MKYMLLTMHKILEFVNINTNNGTIKTKKHIEILQLITDNVLLFHSTLQLIIAPSSEYSDQPKNGAKAQNNPTNKDNKIAMIRKIVLKPF